MTLTRSTQFCQLLCMGWTRYFLSLNISWFPRKIYIYQNFNPKQTKFAPFQYFSATYEIYCWSFKHSKNYCVATMTFYIEGNICVKIELQQEKSFADSIFYISFSYVNNIKMLTVDRNHIVLLILNISLWSETAYNVSDEMSVVWSVTKTVGIQDKGQ